MLLGARFAEVIIPGANAETEIVAGVDIASNATRANSSEFIVAVVISDFVLSIDSRVDSNSSTDTITVGQPTALKRDMMMTLCCGLRYNTNIAVAMVAVKMTWGGCGRSMTKEKDEESLPSEASTRSHVGIQLQPQSPAKSLLLPPKTFSRQIHGTINHSKPKPKTTTTK